MNHLYSFSRQVLCLPALVVSIVLNTLISAAGTPGSALGDLYLVLDPPGGGLTTSVSGSSFCAGSSVAVSFSAPGAFQAGNTFTAQLSNSSGSFASPVTIGSLSGIYSGSIQAVIPAGTPAGSGYRIRVVASAPAEVGDDNGADLSVVPGVQITSQPSRSSHKLTQAIAAPMLSVTASGGSGLTYQWYRSLHDNNAGGVAIGGATSSTYQPPTNTLGTAHYFCTVSNSSGCSATSQPSGFLQVCSGAAAPSGSGNTTQVSACDSYTWAQTGQTYTQSGEYTSTSGSHTETLWLTITPSSQQSSTVSACSGYTWSVNGTTYTQSGTYSSVSGCNTQIISLTIIPATSNTITASSCESYSWSANGVTYTQSGTYTVVSGCSTELLSLTITGATSTNTTNAAACTTYTWSANSTTYTQSGSYTAVSGCVTEVLNLTIENLCDVDGNAYDTVVIGTQVWFSENLKVSNYRNGDAIPTGLSDASWQATSSGAYAIYNNDAANDQTYGKLYNWYAVADSRGLCPTGWHVPSDVEWTTLTTFLGGTFVAGGKMKAVSPLWTLPNTDADNSSGFTGLPGGGRASIGSFNYIGHDGVWWSSTQLSSGGAWLRNLYYGGANVNRNSTNKTYGFSVRCVRDVPPTVTTSSVTSVTQTGATCGGNVTNSGSDAVTARGVVWSTSPSPTVALTTKTSDGSGTGSFTSSITGLNAGTTYYVRAYATNGVATGYGSESTFTTLAPGQFTDIDGNIYDTIAIGTQVWMKQNLKVSNYRNGDAIPTGLSDASWQATTSGAYAIYNNNAAFDQTYGKLYNWYAVADPRGLCPTGWHVPSDAEWTTLTTFLGPLYAGGEMKAVSPLWQSPNTGANNSSGFTGLPGGIRAATWNGNFNLKGLSGYWWSSTQYSSTNAWYRILDYDLANVTRFNSTKALGSSVRCVRD